MIGCLEAGKETELYFVIFRAKLVGTFGIRTRIARAIFDFNGTYFACFVLLAMLHLLFSRLLVWMRVICDFRFH